MRRLRRWGRATAAAVLATLGVLALTLTGHFDLPTLIRVGGPIAAVFALLPVVFEVTARRVVTQPEPASADDELLWADARRADVLNHLASPVPHHRCQPRLGLRADRRLPDLRAGQHLTLRRDGHHH